MNTIYVDSTMGGKGRRERLYDGQLLTFTPRPSTKALCDHARGMIKEAFHGHNPLTAQYSMTEKESLSIAASLKARFAGHARVKEMVRAVLEDLGCDPEKTYFEAPRLHVVASEGKQAPESRHQPYRETWCAAPMCQVNWWLPVYDVEAESSLVFYPQYWRRAVKNGSHAFDYSDWSRENAAKQIGEARTHPTPEEPVELDPQIRVVTEAAGLILFSAAQLHSTAPNTSGVTCYSIDFRTVHIDDVLTKRGAENVDAKARGTSLRNFMRSRDLRQIPEDVAQLYDNVSGPQGAHLGVTSTQA